MKWLFLSIIFSFNISAFAQLKPIYFLGDELTNDSTKATSYGIYGKLSGEELYALKIFDLNNNLKLTGTYKDEQLKIPHGNFVYYDDIDFFNSLTNHDFSIDGKTRFITGKGAFVNGLKSGRWISFFPDGKIMNVTTYVNGIKHGFFGTYTRRGKVAISGLYVADKKDGEWLYDNGRTKETFIKGVKQVKSKKNKN